MFGVSRLHDAHRPLSGDQLHLALTGNDTHCALNGDCVVCAEVGHDLVCDGRRLSRPIGRDPIAVVATIRYLERNGEASLPSDAA